MKPMRGMSIAGVTPAHKSRAAFAAPKATVISLPALARFATKALVLFVCGAVPWVLILWAFGVI